MLKRRMMAIAMAMIIAAGLAACGGSGSEGSAAKDGRVTITIFNSKNEIQEPLEELAAAYGEANNVDIEVYYSQDTVSAHLATKYASHEPYTINMVDAKDVYSLGKTYGADMTGMDWTKDTDYAITVDDKTVGYPVCIEARGLLYNADAIKKATGEDFDPASIRTLDDLKAEIEKLKAAGMEAPAAILKPDWSLAAHYSNQIIEQRDDPEAFVQDLYAGKVDLAGDEKYNALVDTFDVLKENNLFRSGPTSVEDAQVHQALSEGQAAFQFGGCWEWNDIIDFDYTGNVGIMPLPQNVSDSSTGKLVGGGSKYFYLDNSEFTTDEQREAAEKFLDWFTSSDEGKTFVSDTCGMVSAFKGNTVPCTNDIGAIVKEYVDAGNMVANYDYNPDDHISRVGSTWQKYLAEQIDRTQLAAEIEDYWKSTTPVEH